MIEELKEYLNPDVIIEVSGNERLLVLKEEGADSKIRKLNVNNLPDNYICFTLDFQPKDKTKRDAHSQLSCYFNKGEKLINRGCDAVIVGDLGEGNIDVILLELKSDKPKLSDVKSQLLNSELFLRYITSVFESHKNKKFSSILYRKTVVSTKRRNPTKGNVYKGRAKKQEDINFVDVQVNARKEGRVYFPQL